MRARDPYDPVVAFDDVLGGEAPPRDAARVAAAIIREARRSRLAPPPMSLRVVDYDPTAWSFQVLGQSPTEEPEPAGLPIFDDLHRRFAAATPAPKLVRLDTEESYGEFRDARRAPYIARLEERLRALEEAYAAHVADDHGGGRLAALEDALERHVRGGHGIDYDVIVGDEQDVTDVLGDAVVGALGEVAHGGARVPLPLQEWVDGKIECWQDGDEILCTIRLLGPDGRLRLATTGTPVARHVDQVIGCAAVLGAEFEEVAVAGPLAAQMVAGESLIPQLCRAAPDLLSTREAAREHPIVGAMSPRSNPAVAATMALLQRGQQGDRRAQAEALEMSRSSGALFGRAREQLVRAQRNKSRGRSS